VIRITIQGSGWMVELDVPEELLDDPLAFGQRITAAVAEARRPA
jgi:hypothetical protein